MRTIVALGIWIFWRLVRTETGMFLEKGFLCKTGRMRLILFDYAQSNSKHRVD
jgi:hypothetical protein